MKQGSVSTLFSSLLGKFVIEINMVWAYFPRLDFVDRIWAMHTYIHTEIDSWQTGSPESSWAGPAEWNWLLSNQSTWNRLARLGPARLGSALEQSRLFCKRPPNDESQLGFKYILIEIREHKIVLVSCHSHCRFASSFRSFVRSSFGWGLIQSFAY